MPPQHLEYLGETLALSAALCWTVSMISFAAAGRRVGSLPVNVIRLVMALLFLSLYGLFKHGSLLPIPADSHTWFWLLLSGFVGFFLGDLFLFRAFIEIGPRMSAMMMSLAPAFAAIVGWLWLGEMIGPRKIIGMAVTLAGVTWVALERQVDREKQVRKRPSTYGILLGVLGAAGQGVGLVMAKKGMGADADGQGGYNAVAATQIRALAGLAGFFLLLAWRRRFAHVTAAFKQPLAIGIITIGAVAGPFIGVSLLLKSAQLISSGVAQTLASMTPVLILPFAILIEKEHVSGRAAFGAVVAVAGVVMLFEPFWEFFQGIIKNIL